MSGGSTTAQEMTAAGVAMSVETRLRHDWLDALKGLGIIAVVAGHIWTRGQFRDAIYSFHMPLFFMATGAVARAGPARTLMARLAQSLGLPFVSFAVLLLACDFLVEGLRGVRPVFPDALSGASTILFATETLRGPFGILWFVPCLFFARLIWNSLLGWSGAALSPVMLLAMALVAFLAVVADWRGGHSPLGLLPVPAALLAIWMGAVWRDWRPGRPSVFVASAVALLALFWFPPLNLRAGEIGWPLAGLIGAAAVVDRLGWAMRNAPPWLVERLAWFGRNSLAIMFAHLAFVHYLWAYLPKPALFTCALAGSALIGVLARQSRISRLLLLGER